MSFSPPQGRRDHKLAVSACLVAALALSGCGRKGGLDAPPGASLANQPPPQSAPELTPEGQPVQLLQPAPPPPKRTPLDWLID